MWYATGTRPLLCPLGANDRTLGSGTGLVMQCCAFGEMQRRAQEAKGATKVPQLHVRYLKHQRTCTLDL